MSWFDRRRGDEPSEVAYARLAGLMERSGVNDVLVRACGRPGLRRFVVRFERRGARVRVGPVDSRPLAEGGGPPPAFDPVALEAAVERLATGLRAPWSLDRGAFGIVRDGDGAVEIAARFDEDADGYGLADLRTPRGEAHPLDHPAWTKALRDWSARMATIRWVVPAEAWTWDDALVVDGGVLPADRVGVWRAGRFEWLLDEPAGDEAPLCEPSLTVALPEAVELVALAAARRGHAAVFRGEAEDGAVVFGGLR